MFRKKSVPKKPAAETPQPVSSNDGYEILNHALDLEWRMYERQEKQAQHLVTIYFTLISLFPTLYSLTFGQSWNIWEIHTVAASMLALAAGVLKSLELLRLRPLESQNAASLEHIVSGYDRKRQDDYWNYPKIKRDRALVLAKTTKSIAERRNRVATIQKSLLDILLAAIGLIIVSTLVGIINI